MWGGPLGSPPARGAAQEASALRPGTDRGELAGGFAGGEWSLERQELHVYISVC